MLLVAGLVFGGTLLSQVQKNGEGNSGGEGGKKPVDYTAEIVRNDRELFRSLGLDEQARILVGNVAFHHNGAIISCDSAVQYSDNHIDCFKNAIVNKDSTFIYGDRVEFNGNTEIARVYSPVIKVVDGDATLYTYNFSFDTRNNIGRWFGGGVVYQQDNIMESEAGWFFSDQHELVAVRGVQMKNDTHQLISDSVRYNTETKVASFYTRTYIWTNEGEIISAERGRYDTRDSSYFFYRNAYVLDEFRETWADTIDYRAREGNAVFYGDIQIDDNEYDSSVFGDLAHYWGERGETRITRRPSLLNYDADQGNADTLYMRADTIFMFVVYPSDSRRTDSLAAAPETADRFAHLKWVDSLSDSTRVVLADSLAGVISGLRLRIDGLRRHADSIMTVLHPQPPSGPGSEFMPLITDTLISPVLAPTGPLPPADTLPATDSIAFETPLVPVPVSETTPPPEVAELRARAAVLSAEADSLQAAETYIRPRTEGLSPGIAMVDSLARLRVDSILRADSLVRVDSIRIADPKAYKKLRKAEAKRLKAEKTRLAAERREAKFAEKAAARAEKQRLKAERRAAKAAEKAAAIARRRQSVGRSADSLSVADSLARDSLLRPDSLPIPADSLAARDSLPPGDGAEARSDTTMRIFRGWYNVKIWRKDMQAVADSMVGFSVDSTLHMYLSPILWHADSQVTSDSTTLYTVGQQIDHAEFFGDPIMASQIGGPGSNQFNQVKGRQMASWFENGELRRHDTEGNALALYYIQEEEQASDGRTAMSEALAFMPLTAASMSFIFEADSLRYIVARGQPDYDAFPMDQIPGTQMKLLQGFVWQAQRQPTLIDVFDRRVRPTERDFYENLARPEFPIAARIDRRREYLIENRMWADRTDPLPDYAIEFREKYRPLPAPVEP